MSNNYEIMKELCQSVCVGRLGMTDVDKDRLTTYLVDEIDGMVRKRGDRTMVHTVYSVANTWLNANGFNIHEYHDYNGKVCRYRTDTVVDVDKIETLDEVLCMIVERLKYHYFINDGVNKIEWLIDFKQSAFIRAMQDALEACIQSGVDKAFNDVIISVECEGEIGTLTIKLSPPGSEYDVKISL